jgi:hypothetical protein
VGSSPVATALTMSPPAALPVSRKTTRALMPESSISLSRADPTASSVAVAVDHASAINIPAAIAACLVRMMILPRID